MTPPSHSVDPPSGQVGGDLYASRNIFLYLLLGLISTAEQMLSALPHIESTGRHASPGPSTDEPAPNRILR